VKDLGGLDHLRRVDPKRATQIDASGDVLGYSHRRSLAAGLGVVGGIYPSPYRGSYLHCPTYAYYSPWGFTYYSGSFSFALCFPYRSWWSPCYSWWWPSYVSCWYPWWYVNYWEPYPSWWYCPATYSTVVYRTVYVDREEEILEDAVIEEPAAGPVAEAAPPAPRLGIAAERYLVLGDRAFREGRYTDAVQFYAKAIELDSDEGALFLVLSDALFAAGDYHYAAYAIRRAMELEPSLADAFVDKHGFYGDPSAFDAQVRLLEEYVSAHPTDRDARLVLIVNYLFGQRVPEALAALDLYRSSGLKVDEAIQVLEASASRLTRPEEATGR
jgi:hypothetical protein